jgi:DNA-binding HxlR family transcriptional regulator
MNSPSPTNMLGAEKALTVLAPRWTTWILQTLHRNGPLRRVALSRELPFVRYPTLFARVQRMTEDGLLLPRARGTSVTVSQSGASLTPVYAAVADWSRRHALHDGATVAEAERVEDAMRRLKHRHASTLSWVAEHPGATVSEVGAGLGLARMSAVYRLEQLVADGLLRESGRTAGRRGTMHLTDAGREVPSLLTHFASWATGTSTILLPPVGAVRQAVPRTTAALRRSSPAPASGNGLLQPTFSHVETAHPWTRPAGPPAGRGR